MNPVEAREHYLNFNIKLTEQLFNIKFDGTSLEDKEAFVEQFKEQRDAATDRILSEMYDVKVMINRALGIFPKAFIKRYVELNWLIRKILYSTRRFDFEYLSGHLWRR
ncbi:hypothetical protein [Lysinibacillus pakistanensis]|uniref:hypothetical protein n=1 Tax=Lysinibacillus pakistanensis TaxID=759811 RepID=UPI003D2975B4